MKRRYHAPAYLQIRLFEPLGFPSKVNSRPTMFHQHEKTTSKTKRKQSGEEMSNTQRMREGPRTPTETRGTPPSGPLISTLQIARPYLTKNQILHAQRHTIDNRSVYDQRRNQVFTFLMKICQALKFPVRTLESAMIYYQRFYLHNKFEVGGYYDVALTCLFVSIKNEDTVKKLRDIILASAQLRNIQLNTDQVESYRRKLMGLEFKLLETVSFDFRVYHIEEWIVKIGKTFDVTPDVCYLAWLIAYDTFQLELALKIPVTAIAFATLHISSVVHERTLRVKYQEYGCTLFSVNEATLDILEFYMNHFNFSILASMRPDLKDALFNIKLGIKDDRVISERPKQEIEQDQYFSERDFTVGERRYMLSVQRKRLYAEVDGGKK